MAEKIEQPGFELQEAIDMVMHAEPSVVTFDGKRRKITWLHKGTVRKFSHIMVSDKDPWRRNVKVCASILLNKRYGYLTWLLQWAWHWLYWRWLYYVRDIDQVEVLAVLDASKKKIQSDPLVLATILSTAMMDTMMTMARHEFGQAAQAGVAHSA